ncbi:MAG TPA: hypothetical protein VE907_14910 [Gammaproteobacteria bacterium]|nr:hypothetical protein [Gammaproteobacteria bacterium]
MTKEKVKRGPKEDRVKIEGKWENAIDKALAKKRPKGGWPKDEKPPKDGTADEESQKPTR